jgi:hypothetical protein
MPRHRAPSLVKVLAETRPAMEHALVEAEEELAELDARRAELAALIARAGLVLGEDREQTPRAPAQRLTLHEAMECVLDEHPNQWMTVHDLAEVINERTLYEKRDRLPVEPSQIQARANKYPSHFEKDGPRVRRIAARAQP